MRDRAAWRGTTVLACVAHGRAAIGSDGQITLGGTVVKSKAHKVRRLHGGRVLAGFAGAAADGLHLFERFEAELEASRGRLQKAAVALAKHWRSDRVLRRLDAQLVACDQTSAFLISGAGDIIQPDDGIVATGSGGPYALAACRAIRRFAPDLPISETVREALRIASGICIYTNEEIEVLEL